MAHAKTALSIWLFFIVMVAQDPKIKQQPKTKIIMRFLPKSADLKLKNGISLTSR